MTVRSRFRQLLALCVLAAGLATSLLSLAGPAQAATSPAPSVPVEISLPNLVKQPPTAPSHPVKIEVPGVAKIELGLPDVAVLLGGNKAAAATPAPTSPASNTPAPTTSDPNAPGSDAPSASAPQATSGPSRPAPAVTPTPTAAAPSATAGGHGSTKRTTSPVAVDAPVRSEGGGPTSAAKEPVTPGQRAAAEAFRGMLKGSLPVWLLVGIVVACAAGTVVVVRSGRRQEAS